MQVNEPGRAFSRRSRLGKRMPQDPNAPISSDSGVPPADPPIVDPTTPPTQISPTVTVFVDPNGALTTPGPLPSSDEVVVTITTPAVVTPSSLAPIPSSTSKNGGKSSDNAATGSSPGGMPVGTIVGVILAIIIVLGAVGAFFFFRRRSMQRRMATRGWVNNKGAAAPTSSFLFLDDKEQTSSKGHNVVAPFSSPKIQARSELSKDFTYPRPPPPTFNSYQPTNNGLPYIPPPAPPRPPPAHGYDYNPSAPSSPTPNAPVTVPPTPKSAGTDLLSPQSTVSRFPASIASASILSPLTPGTMPPLPTLPSPSSYPLPEISSPITFAQPVPLASAMPEMVKIKSTFIPTLPDELTIDAGETVRVKKEFDDGWALCVNAKGEQGMIPLECLDRGRSRESKKLARASSLAARSYGGIY